MHRSPYTRTYALTGKYLAKRGTSIHKGVDHATPRGAMYVAVAPGVVTAVKKDGVDYKKTDLDQYTAAQRAAALKQSNRVVVKHDTGIETRAYHFSEVLVKTGDRVVEGQVLALGGNTGYSTGPHTHLEVWKNGAHVDPAKYIDFNKYNIISQLNNEMIQLQQAIRIQTTNTKAMNFRKEPSTSAATHTNKINGGVIYQCNKVASGTSVNGNTTWYQVVDNGNTGWISGGYVRELATQADSAVQLELLKAKLSTLEKEKDAIIKKQNGEADVLRAKLMSTEEITKAQSEKLAAANESLEKYKLAYTGTQLTEVAAVIAEEQLPVDGWITWWGKQIDKKIKSETLRSIFKYDIFVAGGMGLAYLLAMVPDWHLQQWQVTVLTTTVGIALKLLTARYDQNKDGKLDRDDLKGA